MDFPDYSQFKTFDEFYEFARRMAPFDVPWNHRGFARQDSPGNTSCQAALMPVLTMLARQCDSIWEFGCREGYSTAAFLKGNRGVLTSVDFQVWPVHHFLQKVSLPVSHRFVYRDIVSGDWEINDTDWLHVDDLHIFEQVERELAIHGKHAQKYLSFHDTVSQGEYSLDVKGARGINPAIDAYTAANDWVLIYEAFFNHGLRIYQRKS